MTKKWTKKNQQQQKNQLPPIKKQQQQNRNTLCILKCVCRAVCSRVWAQHCGVTLRLGALSLSSHGSQRCLVRAGKRSEKNEMACVGKHVPVNTCGAVTCMRVNVYMCVRVCVCVCVYVYVCVCVCV